MKVIYNLFKKDFLLIRKYLPIILGVIMIFPIFISYRTPLFQRSGNILYDALVLMITFMVYHSVSMEEMKQKGEIYLRITPMQSNKIAIAKYIVVTFSFVITTALFLILSNIPITNVGKIDIKNIFLVFVLIEIFFSIYIPMTFKFGYVKLQLISTSIIFVSPFIIPLIANHVENDMTIIANIQNSPIWMIVGLSLLIVCASINIGIMASSNIIKNKEY